MKRRPSAAALLVAALSLGGITTTTQAAPGIRTTEGVGQAAVAGDLLAAKEHAKDEAMRSCVRQVTSTVVTASTETDQAQLLSDQVFSRSAAYVEQFQILDDRQDGDLWVTRLRCDVSEAKLDEDLMALGIAYRREGMPRMFVLIAEQAIDATQATGWWQGGGDTADLRVTEHAFRDRMEKSGFTFVAPEGLQGKVNLEGISADPSIQQAREIGVKTGAEVVIVGRAVAKPLGELQLDHGTFYSAVANVSARAVRTDTGEVLAAWKFTGPAGRGFEQTTAGRNALSDAGRQLARDLFAKIGKGWANAQSGARRVVLTVSGGDDHARLARFEDALSSVRGVKHVQERSMGNGKAALDVTVTGRSADLATELATRKFPGFAVKMKRVTAASIDLELRDVEPQPPANVAVERFPSIEAPDTVEPGDEFEVLVSLTEEQLTSDVRVTQGAATAGGKLAMSLPEPSPGVADGWTIRVVLTAGAFDIAGRNFAEIRLPRAGSSTPAAFTLKARSARGETFLYATFWHEHAFLGRAVKRVQVGARAVVAASTPGQEPARRGPDPRPRASAFVFGDPPRAPDLTLTVIVGTDPARPRRAEVDVDSPWVQVPRSSWDVPEDLVSVASAEYLRFARASRGMRPADDPGAPAPAARDGLIAELRGFGTKRWLAAPPALQQAIVALEERRGSRFETILVITNEPRIPWELFVPGGGEFLGTRYRVARWHLAESGGIRARPDTRVPLDGVFAIAPRYGPGEELPSQAKELAAVRAAMGDRLVVRSGTRESLREEARGGRAGILHFAGHGAVVGEATAPEYVLRLTDGAFSATEWRGLSGQGAPRLVFLNACDLGQANRAAGVVDGWAPAVLDSGAAGYVGGLWPIGDQAAADAARRFYESVKSGAPVSEALRVTRRAFFERGDPTYLAYVFYGDPYLTLELPAR